MAKKKYEVLSPLQYGTFVKRDERFQELDSDVKDYAPGDMVELDEKEAEPLVAAGTIIDPAVAKEAKERAKKKAEERAKKNAEAAERAINKEK